MKDDIKISVKFNDEVTGYVRKVVACATVLVFAAAFAGALLAASVHP